MTLEASCYAERGRWSVSIAIGAEVSGAHRADGASIVGAGVGCATLMNNYRTVYWRTRTRFTAKDAFSLLVGHRSERVAQRDGVSLSGPLRLLRHAPWEVHATNDALLKRRNPPTNRFIMQKVSRNKWTRRTAPGLHLLLRDPGGKWTPTMMNESISTWLWFITTHHHSRRRFIWKNYRFIGALPAARIFMKLTAPHKYVLQTSFINLMESHK